MYFINAFTQKGSRVNTGKMTRSLSMSSAKKKAKFFVNNGKVCEIVYFQEGKQAKVIWKSDEIILN